MRTRHASPVSLAGLTTWTLVMRVFHSLIAKRPKSKQSPEPATHRDYNDPSAHQRACQCEHRCDNQRRVTSSRHETDPFDLDGGTDSSVGVVCVHGFTGTPY